MLQQVGCTSDVETAYCTSGSLPEPDAFPGGVLVTGAGGRTGALIYKQLKDMGVENVRASVFSLDKARSQLGCNKCDASEGIYVGERVPA